MWVFWWLFPLLGILVCLGMIVMMVRAMRGGSGFMCMGGHQTHGPDQTADLRRELGELRKQVEELKASR
jgi:hypothetical protein